jgi:hypothetical protein
MDVFNLDSGDIVTVDEITSKLGSFSTYTETRIYGGVHTWAAMTFAFYASNFTWLPPMTVPCCGLCRVTGGDVKVFYWPTPAPSPPTSILVNDEGFTL